MRRVGRRRFALALLAAAGACGAPLDVPERVHDLRVLGVRLDPPELVVAFADDASLADVRAQLRQPLVLRGLLVDPGAARRLRWSTRLCPPTASKRCDDPGAPVVAVGEGVFDSGRTDSLAVEFVLDPDLVLGALQLDPLAAFSGVTLQLELAVWPDGQPDAAVVASKRLVVAPPLPQGRVANQNPRIEALVGAGTPLAATRCGAEPPSLRVARGASLELAPVAPGDAREAYALPTFDGGARHFVENLRYSWFATDGQFQAAQTGGPIDAFGNVPSPGNRWTAPETPGDVSLWLVQRDERGGLDFASYCIRVTP